MLLLYSGCGTSSWRWSTYQRQEHLVSGFSASGGGSWAIVSTVLTRRHCPPWLPSYSSGMVPDFVEKGVIQISHWFLINSKPLILCAVTIFESPPYCHQSTLSPHCPPSSPFVPFHGKLKSHGTVSLNKSFLVTLLLSRVLSQWGEKQQTCNLNTIICGECCPNIYLFRGKRSNLTHQ